MKSLAARWSAGVLALVVAGAGVTATLWGADGGNGTAATAPAGDAISHYRKAKDLFDKEKYAEAQTEVNEAMRLDPQLQDAKLLASRIQARLSETTTTGTAPATAKAPEKTNLLTPEQISRIRLYEMEFTPETKLRGSFAPKTLDDFWEEIGVKDPAIGDNPAAAKTRFMASDFTSQVKRIRDAGATQYYARINLLSDPQRLINFRKTVQPYLLQNCATSGCHTPADPHGYPIFTRPTDAETYTNFYLLSQYAKNGAQMLDRVQPGDSLFLQYALAGAPNPHPGKVSPKMSFPAKSDARYTAMEDWVKSLAYPRPNYSISYTPTPPTATAPAK